MFPDLEFIKTCLNGLRSRIEQVENWVVSFVRANRPNWAQNDPDALDYIKGRTHYEVNGKVVQLPSKFLPSPTAGTVGAIKADSAKTTDIQPVRLGTDGKLYSSGIPIFTTSGTGSAYTANVPEITELVDGMLVVMIPHVESASTKPTLNINGLGAYEIQRFLSSQTGVAITIAGIYRAWLKSGVPVILMYKSGLWFACNLAKPDVQDLFGKVSISQGGTGASFLTKGSYLVGNDISKVLLKTPSEVLADIGAIPVPATASVGQVIAVKAVDADGKPTEWEAVDMASGSGSGGSASWVTLLKETLDGSVVSWEFTGLDCADVQVCIYCPVDLQTQSLYQSVYINDVKVDLSRMIRQQKPTAVNTYSVVDGYVKQFIEFGGSGSLSTNEGKFNPFNVGNKINTFKFIFNTNASDGILSGVQMLIRYR